MFNDEIKNPSKKYRPAPFWSWNEKLDPSETARQVEEMEKAGLGGYFMHARGGLQTEYLSDEWFDNIEAALNKGEELGMHSFGYDENGWPSGFGSGAVNGLGEKYQQKYLRMEITAEPVTSERTITNISLDGKNHHFYYEVNPFYVDTLDGEITDEFLKSTHEKYKNVLAKDFGKMDGFFTDEPQVSRNGLPWSFVIEREYEAVYGEKLTPELYCLFLDKGDYRRVRYNFWKLVRDLFAENYMGKIGDWCEKNGTALTGHMVLEEGFYSHVLANGCCMAPYEYMHIPGMDHLGRSVPSIQTMMQLTSVANQLGKKQILSETFAMCGWNVSFEELRWIYESQLVRGVNLLCQHLEGYSLRGIRKRDYPATLFKQQPWWKYYRGFNDFVSRMGYIMAEGKIDTEVLILHTVETAWINFKVEDRQKMADICSGMTDCMRCLEAENIQYHLGDERIMKRYGKVDGAKLTVGTQSYGAVIVPPAECISESTLKLLREFKDNGGLLIFAESVPEYVEGTADGRVKALAENCPVVPRFEVADYLPDSFRKIKIDYEADRLDYPIITGVRRFPEEKLTVYYLVNPKDICHNAKVTVKGGSVNVFDPYSGNQDPIAAVSDGENLTFDIVIPVRGSCVLFVSDDKAAVENRPEKGALVPLNDKLSGEWEIKDADDNTITLDYCDVYFDGEKKAVNVPVGDVEEMACAYGRPVDTRLIYYFNVKSLGFKKCELAVETPEIFDIFVNGKKVDRIITGYMHDVSFKTIDVYKHVKEGLNEIELRCTFEQSPAQYENIKKSVIFESEKNKLSFGMELEAVYLKGDFSVFTDDVIRSADRRAEITNGRFYLSDPVNKVKTGSIVGQGYPFFAGSITFVKKIDLTAKETENRSITFPKLCSTVTDVTVNGVNAGQVMWHPYTVDVSGLLKEGENTVEITVTGNLRNLLGPFHLIEGESYAVGPGSFYHYSPIWKKGINKSWVDSYCFVEFGIFF